MATPTHPFAVSEPGSVPLREAPLVRAVGQIRFPNLTRFAVDGDAVATLIGAELAQRYPLMQVGHEVAEILTAEGVSQERRSSRIWRLTSSDRHWRITFSGSFLSVDTSNYRRREEFVERLVEAWAALSCHVKVPSIDRIGVRYVNQLTDKDQIDRIRELIRPEVLGVAVARQPEEAELISALTEVQYGFGDGASFTSRWGLLPAGTAVDPELDVFDYPTWVLDMDSFREFDLGEPAGGDLRELILELALRGYQFFRWTVTEEGLTEFGGDHGI
ncbi:TIGR04255 family protein [Nocardia sp. NPDC051833]|uniref:TIGR04255 family protein n=1 Tax=Nocardia sp. NPDC051833 TaxID=3155674 RepID=UPI00342A75DB